MNDTQTKLVLSDAQSNPRVWQHPDCEGRTVSMMQDPGRFPLKAVLQQ